MIRVAVNFYVLGNKNKILKKTKNAINKHNAELEQTDRGTKDTGNFNTRGHIFPHNAQNGYLLFPSF